MAKQQIKKGVFHVKHFTKYKPEKVNKNTIFTLDIETTSYFITPNGVQAYTEEYIPTEYNDFNCGATCYIWQFSINNKVFFGRYLSYLWDFLQEVFSNFYGDGRPIIWVHNLAFETQFIQEYIPIKNNTMFCRQKRKPMKYEATDCGRCKRVEFRCSYMLTRLSLDAWGASLGIKKLKGYLNYSIIRTPKTKLNKKELAYAERDCLIVYKGISAYLNKYSDLEKIPLTQTGEVRLEVKEKLKNHHYNKKVTSLQPKTKEQYQLLRAIFAGGSTGANFLYVGQVLYNIGSHDLQSDYPFQMCAEKYPMTPFQRITPSQVKKETFNNYAYIIVCTFTDLDAKTCLHYFSKHKALSIHDAIIDNGKIVSASKLTVAITEQDLLIFEKCYSWLTMEIHEAHRAYKKYLPKKFILEILEKYEYKTTLKGTTEKQDLYAQSKQFINCLYGMSVTDLCQPNIEYNNGEWEQIENDVQKQLDMIQSKPSKNFLSFAWGCWVTAYARSLLWLGMLATPNDIAYWDTDSRKHYMTEEVQAQLQKERKQNYEKLLAMCNYYDIPIERVAPKDTKGKARIIGDWDFEGIYDEFITLGAKRYATKKNGKIEVTVSGVPKKAGSSQLKDLHDFKEGLEFDPNHKDEKTGLYDGKMLSTYRDGDNPHVTLNKGCYDEYTTTNNFSLNLRNTGYKLTLTDEYKNLLNDAIERGLVKHGTK